MKKNIVILSFATVLIFSFSHAQAKITAVMVRGSVAYKSKTDWIPLKTGMTLSQGTKISTGVNSTAIIAMDSHTVTIKPLTMIKIYENSLSKNRSGNRIGLRRGTIRAKVSRSKRIKTVFKVSTPVATSSVRGTEEIISFGPSKGMNVKMISGVAVGKSSNGLSKVLCGGLQFQQKPGANLPEDPLDPVKKKALVRLYNKHITRDEKFGFAFNGTDFFSGAGGFIRTLSHLQKRALVNIRVVWPD